jgi:hypothetical protein
MLIFGLKDYSRLSREPTESLSHVPSKISIPIFLMGFQPFKPFKPLERFERLKRLARLELLEQFERFKWLERLKILFYYHDL